MSTTPDVGGVSRRTLLSTGGGGLLTLSLAACGGSGGAETLSGSGYATPAAGRPKEAPMLTELVEEGELPPLEERLPVEADRLVVDAPEYGVYGGTYQGAVLGQGDDSWLERIIGYEPMLRASPSLEEEGLPGTFKDIEMNEAGDEFIIRMREGMRWSDGEPVTADDVMFAIEDVYFNEELNSLPPDFLAVDGEPCTAERVDQFTVRLAYPQPKGGLLGEASRNVQTWAVNFLFYPRHYMEEFLPHLNDGAEELAEEAGFGDWSEYWADRNEWWNNPDKPVLFPWVITSALNEGNLVVAERNPYYWKVDDDGAQLPFIDRLELEVVQEEEVMLLKGVNGELDFHSRHFNHDSNRPVLAEAREDGGFEFVTVETTSMNRMIISLNMNHQDEELRELFQNKDFRIGLSHAIDREEIIDTVYQRQGEPWQAAPNPDSEFYDEEFAKQYTEFDVDLANQYLDDAGLAETDSDGFRLLPSGDRVLFNLDVTTLFPEWTSAADLVTQYWEQVGIDARVNTIERTLFYDRKDPAANEHDANVWAGDGGLHVEMLESRWYFPNGGESNYAMRWAQWFDTHGQGDHAVEPPETVKRQMELAREIPLEPDEEAQKETFRKILEIAKDEFFVIGIALPTDGYGIVTNDLHNVVESFPDSFLYATPGPANPSAWFFGG